MSRQSKQARNAERAKQFAGGGPAKTEPKHGKHNTRYEPGTPNWKAAEAKLGKIRERISGARTADIGGVVRPGRRFGFNDIQAGA